MRGKTIHNPDIRKADRAQKKNFEFWKSPSIMVTIWLLKLYGMDRQQVLLPKSQSFDVIHAHDWMTVFAGLYAREVSGKPLILHIHSLEYDRSGENVNQEIFYIETIRHGFSRSYYCRKPLYKKYDCQPLRH